MMILSDKPIDYITFSECDKRVLHTLYDMDTTSKLVECLLKKYKTPVNIIKEHQKFRIKYDPLLTPMFKLKKFSYNKITDFSSLIFTVKRHSRNIKPFKNEIKFKIPTVQFECENILNIKNNRKPYIKIFRVRFTKNNIAWGYGNVFNEGNICFGKMKPANIYELIQDAPTSNDINNIETQIFYINIYMTYIYSMFFDTAFNEDLISSSNSNFVSLIDFTDHDTRHYIENYLREKYPEHDYLKKINYSFVALKRDKYLHHYLTTLDITDVTKKKGA